MKPPTRPALANRVIIVCVATAIACAVLATIFTGVIADHFVSHAEDERLLGSARGIAQQVGAQDDAVTIARLAQSESAEIAPAGMHMAIFSDGVRVGGDEGLDPLPGEAGCSSMSATHGELVRACVERKGHIAVAYWASLNAHVEAVRSYVGSVLAAIALAAAIALVFSRLLAAWVVAPLSRLRHAIADMPREHPRPIAVDELGQVAEVSSVVDALNEMIARVSSSLTESRRFAAAAAHELRTPLAMASAELELLAETLPPTAGEPLGRVQRTLRSLSARVDSLLVLVAARENASSLMREAVSLGEVIEESVAHLPAERRERLTVDSNETANAADVRGDANLLRMLVDNALDNAFKFSGDLPIVLRLRVDGAILRCEVQDRGPGVPKAERERVFQPFYRAVTASRDGVRGYGLGLALIANIARAHGGSCGFSEVPAGTLLRIELPLWQS